MAYTFRKLDLSGVRTLVQWAEAEGWNPGKYDAELFYDTDPDGFYGYYDGDDLIGGGSLVNYGGAFGFMGFFIMQPQYRGKGLGQQLWTLRRDTLLQRLQPGATIGMDGVLAMQPFYSKGGFQLAFSSDRYVFDATPVTVSENIDVASLPDLPQILAIDRECFGFDRRQFITDWLFQYEGSSFIYLQDEEIVGFAVIRKAMDGYKAGPLFANDAEVAEELFKACFDFAAGSKMYLDVPMKNIAAVELAKKYNGTFVFECGRMYYNSEPILPIDKIFGITTFELG